ncbi:MAG TPA: hypothetical protein PLK41_05200 [Defluviitoga tunisiensis]|jgi:hypothetical protein|nr:hypothetical protein [Defluviitoga tunisiensis]HOK16435.1 hypothetical protein [Defluviitoga tunisiensis]HPP10366.1 hypothetical protein [Defluviitoga tunisiensis]
MKKINFVTLFIISLFLISSLSFSQTQDNVSIPVFVSIPSYASIEVDAERLDYVLDLSSPQNAEKDIKVSVIANTAYQVDVNFVSSAENSKLSEFLTNSFTYQIDSTESSLGVVEKSISVGFKFKDELENDSLMEEELMKNGEFNDKIGNFVFTVFTI